MSVDIRAILNIAEVTGIDKLDRKLSESQLGKGLAGASEVFIKMASAVERLNAAGIDSQKTFKNFKTLMSGVIDPGETAKLTAVANAVKTIRDSVSKGVSSKGLEKDLKSLRNALNDASNGLKFERGAIGKKSFVKGFVDNVLQTAAVDSVSPATISKKIAEANKKREAILKDAEEDKKRRDFARDARAKDRAKVAEVQRRNRGISQSEIADRITSGSSGLNSLRPQNELDDQLAGTRQRAIDAIREKAQERKRQQDKANDAKARADAQAANRAKSEFQKQERLKEQEQKRRDSAFQKSLGADKKDDERARAAIDKQDTSDNRRIISDTFTDQASKVKNLRSEIVALSRALDTLDKKSLSSSTLGKSLSGSLASKQAEFAKQSAVLQDLDKLRRDVGGGGGRGGTPLIGLGEGDPNDPSRRVKQLIKDTKDAKGAIRELGEQAGLSFKRYAAFGLATGVGFKIIASLRAGVQEAIKFEAALTKIQQVLELTNKEASPIGRSIRDTSLRTGIQSSELAAGVNIFAQAGFKDPGQLQSVSELLAKTQLAPTFDDIANTADGLLAIFGQFNLTLNDTGRILDTVNQFSADFAVESKDIFEGVKRGGAAFAETGGKIEDFIGLFSLLRSATRESSDSLGVFFKTGLSQLLTDASQSRLQQLGVTNKDFRGQLQQLSEILFAPGQDDSNRNKIAIDLFGTRQFNRGLTLLREISKDGGAGGGRVKNSLDNAFGSIDRSTAARLDDVGVSLNRLRSSAEEIVKNIILDPAVKSFAATLANIAGGFAEISKFVGPLIPLLTTLGVIIAAKFAKSFVPGFLDRIGGAGFAGNIAGGFGGGGFSKRFRGVGGFARNNAGTILGVGAGLAGAFGEEGGKLSGTGNGALGGLAIGGVLATFLSAFPPVAAAVIALGVVIGGLTGLISGYNKQISDENEKLRSTFLASAAKNGSPSLIIDQLLNDPTFANKGKGFQSNIASNIAGPFVGSLFGGSSGGGTVSNQDINGLFESKNENTQQAVALLRESILAEFRSNGGNSLITGEGRTRTVDKTVDVFLERFNKGLSKRGLSLSSEEELNLKQLLGKILDTAGTQLIQIAEQIAAIPDIIGKEVFNFGIQIQQTVGFINAIGRPLNKIFSEIARRTSLISGDVNAVAQSSLTSDNSSLLKSFFGNKNVFDLGASITDTLSQLFDNPDLRSAFSRFSQTGASGEKESIIQDFTVRRTLENIKATSGNRNSGIDSQFDEIERVINSLSGLSGQNPIDITRALLKTIEGGGSLSDFVAQFTSEIDKAGQSLADIIRKDIEVFNQQIQKSRELNDASRNLKNRLDDLNDVIRNLTDEIENRDLQSARFNQSANGGGRDFDREQALLNLQRSARSVSAQQGTSFGLNPNNNIGVLLQSTDQFIDDLVKKTGTTLSEVEAARKQVNTDNQTGFPSKENIKKLEDAQNNRADLRNTIDRSIKEFDDKIRLASTATDVLRESFLKFKADLASAGQQVLSLTKVDLKESFEVFARFTKAGGLNNATEALNKLDLNDQDSDALKRVLGISGDISLGKNAKGENVTGNDALRQINEAAGLEFIARLRSQSNGKSIDQNRNEVRAELDQRFKDAKAAEEVEKKLRAQQLRLVELQLPFLEDERKFIEEQRQLLNSISGALNNASVLLDQKLTEIIGRLESPIKVKFDFDGTLGGVNSEAFIASENDRIISAIDSLGKNGITASSELTVKPVQVNVAINAPDILKLAGKPIADAVIAKLGPAISQAFGVIDPKAQSDFESSLGYT